MNLSFSHSNQFNCALYVRKDVACTQESSDRILDTYYAQELEDLLKQISNEPDRDQSNNSKIHL